MRPTLKPLREQVIVITGATSGIGLCTVRAAAREGAKLVLAARNEHALRDLASEIEGMGGAVCFAACDVADASAVARLAARALECFGRIDTWVNNAGVSIIAEAVRTPYEDHRRLFDTNYWGVVHGSTVAVQHLRERGGAIVNVGSALSDRSVPLQAAYCASKHAVKGFTDSLRMELEHAGAPISVTLVRPSSIATPFVDHMRAYTEREPQLPAPLYAPELVAHAVLRAATEPVRDIYVGGAARALAALAQRAPRLADRLMEGTLFSMQQTPRARNGRRDALFTPGEGGSERSKRSSERRVLERSLSDRIAERPVRSAVIGALAVLGLAVALGKLR
jgi:short-subunit dehydrogenase